MNFNPLYLKELKQNKFPNHYANMQIITHDDMGGAMLLQLSYIMHF